MWKKGDEHYNVCLLHVNVSDTTLSLGMIPLL